MEIELKLESLFTTLCQGIVGYPEDFKMHRLYSGETLSTYVIHCHAADVPRILGKGGRRFDALKIILSAAGQRGGRLMKLVRVVEHEIRSAQKFSKFKYDPNWRRSDIQALIESLFAAVFKLPVAVKIFDTSEGTAVIDVSYDRNESKQLVYVMQPSVQNVFEAVGVKAGCQLTLQLHEI